MRLPAASLLLPPPLLLLLLLSPTPVSSAGFLTNGGSRRPAPTDVSLPALPSVNDAVATNRIRHAAQFVAVALAGRVLQRTDATATVSTENSIALKDAEALFAPLLLSQPKDDGTAHDDDDDDDDDESRSDSAFPQEPQQRRARAQQQDVRQKTKPSDAATETQNSGESTRDRHTEHAPHLRPVVDRNQGVPLLSDNPSETDARIQDTPDRPVAEDDGTGSSDSGSLVESVPERTIVEDDGNDPSTDDVDLQSPDEVTSFVDADETTNNDDNNSDQDNDDSNEVETAVEQPVDDNDDLDNDSGDANESVQDNADIHDSHIQDSVREEQTESPTEEVSADTASQTDPALEPPSVPVGSMRQAGPWIEEARRYPKSEEKEAELSARYAAIESLEERAFTILWDLGLICVRDEVANTNDDTTDGATRDEHNSSRSSVVNDNGDDDDNDGTPSPSTDGTTYAGASPYSTLGRGAATSAPTTQLQATVTDLTDNLPHNTDGWLQKPKDPQTAKSIVHMKSSIASFFRTSRDGGSRAQIRRRIRNAFLQVWNRRRVEADTASRPSPSRPSQARRFKAYRMPKSEKEERALQAKYAAIEDVGDRAAAILYDLGMV